MRKTTLEQKLIRLGEYNPDDFLKKLYKSGKSCNEIAEILKNGYSIDITPRALSYKIGKITTIRSRKEAKINAIKQNRMIYIKKPEHEKYKRTGLSHKIRMQALERDNFCCKICGNGPKTGYSIEIHHINGPQNDLNNLETLCYMCHRGKHYNKSGK